MMHRLPLSLHAAYCLDSIYSYLRRQPSWAANKQAYAQWASASISGLPRPPRSTPVENKLGDTVWATVLSNLISRGTPTLPSRYVDQQFAVAFSRKGNSLSPAEISQQLNLSYALTIPDAWDGKSCQFAEAVFSPIAIAWLQKALTEALIAQCLTLQQSEWKIAVIERDVPCAHIALADWHSWLAAFIHLYNPELPLPTISLCVVNESHFAQSMLQGEGIVENKLPLSPHDYDILLDIGFLNTEATAHPTAICLRPSASVAKPAMHTTIGRITYGSPSPEALTFFLTHLFRKQRFKSQQISLLQTLISGKTAVAVLPIGSGKQLAYMLAGLLQPALSLVVAPTLLALHNYIDQFESEGISTSAHIDLSGWEQPKITDSRIFRQAQCLFNFFLPEHVHTAEFRNICSEIAQKQHRFGYAIIAEAHCFSPISGHFLPAYARIADVFRRFCTHAADAQPLPLMAYTAIANFGVLNDIKQAVNFNPDNDVLLCQAPEHQNWEIEVLPTPPPTDSPTADVILQMQRVGIAKQKQILQILENQAQKRGAIYCPHIDGRWGVFTESTYFKDTVFHAVIQKYKNLKISAVNNNRAEGQEAFFQYKHQRTNLMLLYEPLYPYNHFADTDYTIHLAAGSSIANFYADACQTNRPLHSYILWSKEANEQIAAQQIEQQFPGIAKEKNILREIFDEVFFPDNTSFNIFCQDIYQRFRVLISTKLSDRKNPHLLFVTRPSGEQYGFINLNTMTTYPIMAENSAKLLDALKNKLLAQYQIEVPDNNEPLAAWLHRYLYPAPTAGIRARLAGEDGESSLIRLGFEGNNAPLLQEILRILVDENGLALLLQTATTHQAQIAATQKEKLREAIIYACGKSGNMRHFIQTIAEHYKHGIQEADRKTNLNIEYEVMVSISPVIHEKVEQLLLQIRTFNDTLRAVYHLECLQLISDYTIHYSEGGYFLLQIRQTTQKNDYADKLANHLRTYVSPADAERVYSHYLPQQPNATTAEVCTDYWLLFYYQHLLSYCQQNLYKLSEACQTATVKGKAVLHDYIAAYTHNRYLNPYFAPNLVDEKYRGGKDDLSIAYQYLQQLGKNDLYYNDVCQLHYAAAHFGKPNVATRLLHIATTFLLYTPLSSQQTYLVHQADIAHAKTKMIALFMELNLPSPQLIAEVVQLKQILITYAPHLREHLDEILDYLLLLYNDNWLEDFNRRFLADYYSNAENTPNKAVKP